MTDHRLTDITLSDPTEGPAQHAHPQIIPQIIGAIAPTVAGKILGGGGSRRGPTATQTTGPTTSTGTRLGQQAGRQSSLTGSLSQKLSDYITRSSTSGSSSTTNISGLKDPTILKFITDNLPGLYAEIMGNVRSNPFFDRAGELATGLGQTGELDTLISNLMGQTTQAGYSAARRQAQRDFSDAIRGISHRAASFGPGGNVYGEGATNRATDQFGRNLIDAFDATQNQRNQLIANLVGQRTSGLNTAIDQLRGLDDRLISTPANVATAFSDILATLPLTRKATSTTRSSSSTTSRTRGSELTRSLTGRMGSSFGTSRDDTRGYQSGGKASTTQRPGVSPLQSAAGDIAGGIVGGLLSQPQRGGATGWVNPDLPGFGV